MPRLSARFSLAAPRQAWARLRGRQQTPAAIVTRPLLPPQLAWKRQRLGSSAAPPLAAAPPRPSRPRPPLPPFLRRFSRRSVGQFVKQVLVPWTLPPSYRATEELTDEELAAEAQADEQILRPVGLFNAAALHFSAMNRQFVRYMHRIGELGWQAYIMYYVLTIGASPTGFLVGYLTVLSGQQDPTTGLREIPAWGPALFVGIIGMVIGPLVGRAITATMQWGRVYARAILIQHTWVRCGLCAGETTLAGIEITPDSPDCQKCQGAGETIVQEVAADGTITGEEVDCDDCEGEGKVPARRTCPACEGVGRIPDQVVLGAETVANRLAVICNQDIEPTAGGDLVLQCPDGESLKNLQSPKQIYGWKSIRGSFVGDYAREMRLREVFFDETGRLSPTARRKDGRRTREQALGYGVGVIFASLGILLYAMQQQQNATAEAAAAGAYLWRLWPV